MLSKKAFVAGMTLMASIWPELERVTKDKDLAGLWYKMLSDLDDERFWHAIERIVKTRKYPPTIADIREAAAEDECELSPEEAWAVVYRDVQKRGYYSEPHYDDWKLEAAKNAIGWHNLCDMTEGEKGAVRAHFMRIYASLSSREKATKQMNDKKLQELTRMLATRLAPGSKIKGLPFASSKGLPKGGDKE